MVEIKDYIKFLGEVIVILLILSVVFGEEGIASNTYNYLLFIEPTLLQDFISSAITVGSQAPGEFSSTFKTSGQPHTIKIYKYKEITYVEVEPAEKIYLRTKYASLEPSPTITDCLVEEKTIELQRNLIDTITVKKVIEDDSCVIYVRASAEVVKKEM